MVTRFRAGDDGSSFTVDRPDSSDFRALLREQRRFRSEQLQELESRSRAVAPEAPLAEVIAVLRDAAQSALAEVDAALGRLDDGSYGRCLDCRRRIRAERLEILPMAALCMACQCQAERAAN